MALPELPALPEVEVEALALPELPALPEGQLPRWRLWHWSHGLLCLLVEVVEMIQLRLAIPHRCAALSFHFVQFVSPRLQSRSVSACAVACMCCSSFCCSACSCICCSCRDICCSCICCCSACSCRDISCSSCISCIWLSCLWLDWLADSSCLWLSCLWGGWMAIHWLADSSGCFCRHMPHCFCSLVVG